MFRWLSTVATLRPSADLPPRLRSPAEIQEQIGRQIQERRVHCWPAVPDFELYEIGVECSAVLTMLNEELARWPAGTAVLLVTDDPTSPIEMERWSDQTGYPILAKRREGALHQFLVRKEAHPAPRRRRGV